PFLGTSILSIMGLSQGGKKFLRKKNNALAAPTGPTFVATFFSLQFFTDAGEFIRSSNKVAWDFIFLADASTRIVFAFGKLNECSGAERLNFHNKSRSPR